MIIREKIPKPLPEPFVKVVVDIERKILAMGCELHIDCADELVSDGSNRKDLWGANIYPDKQDVQFISMINIRPQDDNRSMEIERSDIKEQVRPIITSLLFTS